MDHNITKTGIWTGGPWEGFDVAALVGNDIVVNPNLLPGTHSKEIASYTYPSSSYSDKNIASVPTDILNGTTYTVSFEAKSTVNNDKIRIHFHDPSNITNVVGSEGQIGTSRDGSCDFLLTTQWKKYWVTYTIPANGNSSRKVIIGRLWSGNGTGSISFRQEKVEEGNKATPWVPHINDTYGLANNGYLNKSIEANQFYEY